jgi:uncharacterized protein YaaR (DUF327 family)
VSDIDAVSQSLFFASQSQEARELAQKRKPGARRPVRREGLFSSLLEGAAEELAADGLEIPAETANLSREDAVVRLKDNLDLAGEALKSSPGAENFSAYKKSVKDFVAYVAHKNYEVHSGVARMKVRVNGVPSVEDRRFYLIRIIDEKLDGLARDVLFNHADKLKLLAAVDEISGLVIDLLR